MSGVRIKPLEWELFWKQDEGRREIAHPPIGDSYHVSDQGWWHALDVLHECQSIEAAKAAAQADYEARIRASLASDATPRGLEGPGAWLIRKGGYFYRPNKAGYTTEKANAGRYAEADAKAEAQIEKGIEAVLADDWPDTTPPAPATVEMREALRIARDYVVDALNERQEEVVRVGAYPNLVKREEARLDAIQEDIRTIEAALAAPATEGRS